MAARSAALVMGLAALMLAVPVLSLGLPGGEPVFDRVDAAWRAEHPTQPAVPHPFDANVPQLIPADRVFIHNSQGFLNSLPAGYPAAFEFLLADVGAKGPEPSVGVDSGGRLFFKTCCVGDVKRSDDGGVNWVDATSPLADPATNDPYLWLDPRTDRVYNNDLTNGCTWSTWTQIQALGAPPTIWEGANQRFCYTLGQDTYDHQKVSTGKLPPGHQLAALPQLPALEQATYVAWNTGSVGKIALSLDGGYTFLSSAQTIQGTCSGGLHGRTRSLPDGTLLIPKRDCNRPLVLRSTNFANWASIPVGVDVGSTNHRKNPDIGVDTAGNAYMFWPSGCTDGSCAEPTWMSRSTDGGQTWSSPSIKASPPNVLSTTFHAAVAGSPGRVAVMYYGNDHTAMAPDHVRLTKWHAYITFSLNALDADPTFVTVQLDTEADPIQIGSISSNTDGHNEAGSRNLLDFNDLVLDESGFVVAAYADGCTTVNNCANNPSATSSNSRDNEGIAAINTIGPDLTV
ncbi:MAG TPA: sialidase family protein [Candidatus Thermoplasmatota archaeon]|jgi:hypothetical protein|nr:sialidase family protein [Candidatus Thermoplasmatota archaeon]